MVSERVDVDPTKECPGKPKDKWANETTLINPSNGADMVCCVSGCLYGKDEETGAGSEEIMGAGKGWCYTKHDKSQWGFPC